MVYINSSNIVKDEGLLNLLDLDYDERNKTVRTLCLIEKSHGNLNYLRIIDALSENLLTNPWDGSNMSKSDMELASKICKHFDVFGYVTSRLLIEKDETRLREVTAYDKKRYEGFINELKEEGLYKNGDIEPKMKAWVQRIETNSKK